MASYTTPLIGSSNLVICLIHQHDEIKKKSLEMAVQHNGEIGLLHNNIDLKFKSSHLLEALVS